LDGPWKQRKFRHKTSRINSQSHLTNLTLLNKAMPFLKIKSNPFNRLDALGALIRYQSSAQRLRVSLSSSPKVLTHIRYQSTVQIKLLCSSISARRALASSDDLSTLASWRRDSEVHRQPQARMSSRRPTKRCGKHGGADGLHPLSFRRSSLHCGPCLTLDLTAAKLVFFVCHGKEKKKVGLMFLFLRIFL
jgi:hypothetical protein